MLIGVILCWQVGLVHDFSMKATNSLISDNNLECSSSIKSRESENQNDLTLISISYEKGQSLAIQGWAIKGTRWRLSMERIFLCVFRLNLN
jgi:hypothetical protein